MTKAKNNNQGFIALLSVIIISFVLLLIAVTMNFSSFTSRFNILESEYKEKSSALAEGCTQIAHLKIVENTTFTGTSTEIIGTDTCTYSVTNDNEKTIYSHGEFQNAHTYFKTVINITDPSVPALSFSELTNYP